MRTFETILEKVLILQAQEGNLDAFEKLVERYNNKLTYYVRRLVHDNEKAQDILQMVWLDVFWHIRKLSNTNAFSVWLYRIARNKAVDLVRFEHRFEQLDEDTLAEQESEVENDISIDNIARLHFALQKIKPQHCEVLVLHFLEELSYEEISKVIEKPIGTVRSRIYYAKQELRKTMEEEDETRFNNQR